MRKIFNRPVLVIGIADTGDCNILPLSRVNEKENVNEDFDIKLNPADFPKLKLKYESYVRVHKQNVIHSGNFDLYVGDMANDFSSVNIDENQIDFLKQIAKCQNEEQAVQLAGPNPDKQWTYIIIYRTDF